MKAKISRQELSVLLGDGEALLKALEEAEILSSGPLSQEEVEDALVAYTLHRELDVNLPGVEVILRLRRELIRTRAQVRELLQLLASRSSPPTGGGGSP